jgi:hypothetical protein
MTEQQPLDAVIFIAKKVIYEGGDGERWDRMNRIVPFGENSFRNYQVSFRSVKRGDRNVRFHGHDDYDILNLTMKSENIA